MQIVEDIFLCNFSSAQNEHNALEILNKLNISHQINSQMSKSIERLVPTLQNLAWNFDIVYDLDIIYESQDILQSEVMTQACQTHSIKKFVF